MPTITISEDTVMKEIENPQTDNKAINDSIVKLRDLRVQSDKFLESAKSNEDEKMVEQITTNINKIDEAIKELEGKLIAPLFNNIKKTLDEAMKANHPVTETVKIMENIPKNIGENKMSNEKQEVSVKEATNDNSNTLPKPVSKPQGAGPAATAGDSTDPVGKSAAPAKMPTPEAHPDTATVDRTAPSVPVNAASSKPAPGKLGDKEEEAINDNSNKLGHSDGSSSTPSGAAIAPAKEEGPGPGLLPPQTKVTPKVASPKEEEAKAPAPQAPPVPQAYPGGSAPSTTEAPKPKPEDGEEEEEEAKKMPKEPDADDKEEEEESKEAMKKEEETKETTEVHSFEDAPLFRNRVESPISSIRRFNFQKPTESMPEAPKPKTVRLKAPHQESFGPDEKYKPIHESVIDEAKAALEKMGDNVDRNTAKALSFKKMKEILDRDFGSD